MTKGQRSEEERRRMELVDELMHKFHIHSLDDLPIEAVEFLCDQFSGEWPNVRRKRP